MSEKKITFRLNMDKYDHRLAYEIYVAIPKNQRSDYIRLAMILMHDREEQLKRMRNLLSQYGTIYTKADSIDDVVPVQEEMSEPATNMLSFISQLNAQ